jgi:CBS domain-containing protein
VNAVLATEHMPSALASYARPVVVAALGESAAAVARRLRDGGVGCIVVTRDRRPVGIITDRDVALRVVAEGRDAEATRIDDIVTFDPIVLRASDTVDAASRCMREHGVRRLPIIDEAGHVCGIVTADDLLVALCRQLACMGGAIAEASDSEDSR